MAPSNDLEKNISSDIKCNSPASINESSGSEIWTTTGIQSVPDTLDKSRLLMAFLTNMKLSE